MRSNPNHVLVVGKQEKKSPVWTCGNISIAKVHTSNKVWSTSGSKLLLSRLGALVALIANALAKPELESFGLNHRVDLAKNVLQMQCTRVGLQRLEVLLAQTE